MCAKHLEARVSSLEDKVFGDLDKNGQYTKATDVILGFNSRLGNVLGDYERAVMIMKRLEELETYLDPLYGLHQTTPAGRAAELLANQQQLRQLCQQLQRVQQLQPLLDSQHLQDAEVLRGRLEAAAQRHLEQTRRQAALAARARQLAHHYRAAAATTAAALLRAEARVAAAERA